MISNEVTIDEYIRFKVNQLSIFMLYWDNNSLVYGENHYPCLLEVDEWNVQFNLFVEKYETKNKLGHSEEVSQA